MRIPLNRLAAELTAAGGCRVTAKTINRHVQLGAPVRPDGLIDLAEYTAWLLAELARQERRIGYLGGGRRESRGTARP